MRGARPLPSGMWCCEIELSGNSGPCAIVSPEPHQSLARILVRLHGEPLGYLTQPLQDRQLDVEALFGAAWAQFATDLSAHLAEEGLTSIDRLTPTSRPATAAGACPNRVSSDELVSVVVCTRNRSAILGSCLDHLARLTYPHVEVIVVDNAPADDSTRRVVHAIDDSRFRYVLESRPGLSFARNRGLAEARGRYVGYTDDDVTVDRNWVHGLVRGFGRRGDVGCVTGLVATASISSSAEAYFDARASAWSTRLHSEIFDLVNDRRCACSLYPWSPGLFGTGANFAIDRNLLRLLGGFDEALGAGTKTRGGEDLDIFIRVLLSSRAIAYEPSAVVWHHHRADHQALLTQMFGYGTGLSAFVTKFVIEPSTRWEIIRRLPTGVTRISRIGPQTSKALGERVGIPKGALVMELAGFAAGPLLYVLSSRAVRRARGRAPHWTRNATTAETTTEPVSQLTRELCSLTVSTVICAYTLDRQRDMRLALASVQRQTHPSDEVLLVVDNNEELLRWARSTLSGVQIVPNEHNPGLSGARNTGIAQSRGDVVVFLDDDAAAEPQWLERLLAHYRDAAVLGVGGGVFPGWHRRRPRWFPAQFDWVIGCSYLGLPVEPSPVRNFIGANMSYRREVFERVGGFIPGLGRCGATPWGCEETELGIRVQAAIPGAVFVYDPTASVRHTVGPDRMKFRYFVRRCYAEGLSKAAVSGIVGTQAALASERAYVKRVLPWGVIAGLCGLDGNPLRAGAIVVGLMITAGGYLRGRLAGSTTRRGGSQRQPAQFFSDRNRGVGQRRPGNRPLRASAGGEPEYLESTSS